MLPKIIYDTLFEEKYSAFSSAFNFSRLWYHAVMPVHFFNRRDHLIMKVSSAALTGEISTPFLGEPLDDFTLRKMEFTVKILIPTARKPSTKIVMRLEVASLTRKGWHDRVRLGYMDKNETEECLYMCPENEKPRNLNITLTLGDQTSFYVMYTRTVKAEDGDWWMDLNNTGFSLSWHYTDNDLLAQSFTTENKYFIKLANILHLKNNTDELWDKIKEKRIQYLEDNKEDLKVKSNACNGENMKKYDKKLKLDNFFSSWSDISSETQYENISSKTLRKAEEMFYFLTRCPDIFEGAGTMRQMYYDLMKKMNYPIKQILLTVVRMIVTSRRLQKKRELLVAEKILDLLDEIFSLDIQSLRSDYIPTGGGRDR